MTYHCILQLLIKGHILFLKYPDAILYPGTQALEIINDLR